MTLEQIYNHDRLALDTNIFIHALNNNPKFPLASDFFRYLPRYKGEIFTSIITILETAVHYYKYNHQTHIAEMLDFIEGGRVTTLDVDQAIALRAAELKAQFSYLKAPDAIQLATAVNQKAQLFLTYNRKDFRMTTIATVRVVTLS